MRARSLSRIALFCLSSASACLFSSSACRLMLRSVKTAAITPPNPTKNRPMFGAFSGLKKRWSLLSGIASNHLHSIVVPSSFIAQLAWRSGGNSGLGESLELSRSVLVVGRSCCPCIGRTLANNITIANLLSMITKLYPLRESPNQDTTSRLQFLFRDYPMLLVTELSASTRPAN